MNPLSLRPAVRGLVIDTDERILLVRLVFPHGAWWVLPGGGIAEGETDIDALHRELAEEIGLTSPHIGALVWNRTHVFDVVDSDGVQWQGQREAVYMVRTEPFAPAPHMSPEELTAENVGEIRWWTLSELHQHTGPDHLSPTDIAVHVESILRLGIPHTPFEISNITD
jgi:ADP-ribose pyrophosphatase YjhB (NUDIX family)